MIRVLLIGIILTAFLIVNGCSKGNSHLDKGQMREEKYENGQLHKSGRWITLADGTEVKQGLQEVWYENGVKEGEYRYDMGKKQGMTTRWHDNGQKA